MNIPNPYHYETSLFMIIFFLPGIFSNLKSFQNKVGQQISYFLLTSVNCLVLLWSWGYLPTSLSQSNHPLKNEKKITTKPALNESWYPACIFIDSIQEWNPLQALLFTPPCICELVSGTWRNQRLWYLFTHTCQWWRVNFQWTTTIPQSQTLSAHLWKQSCERKTRLLPLLDIFPIGFPVSYCCILEHSPPFPQHTYLPVDIAEGVRWR